MADERNNRVIKKLNVRNGVGLELGPLTSPVVKKEQGKIFYLDHMTQKQLKEKYKAEPVELDKIVPIDYVLNGDLKSSVGDKKFDYVIASHVIEHIPDVIGWLEDVSSILKVDGFLSLVIPDKRYTFDIERRNSRPADIIGAHIDKLKKPSSAMMYDFAINYAESIDTESVWNDMGYYQKLPPSHRWSHKEAMDMCVQNRNPKKYVDSHCHVFTPRSFLDILKFLTINQMINFELSYFLPTQPYELEFFVTLRKIGKAKSPQSLLKKIPHISERNIIHEMKNNIAELEKKISNLERSSSWRMTKPLRMIKRVISRH